MELPHARKKYGGVEMKLHDFFISALHVAYISVSFMLRRPQAGIEAQASGP
jgi:hypothetical protein